MLCTSNFVNDIRQRRANKVYTQRVTRGQNRGLSLVSTIALFYNAVYVVETGQGVHSQKIGSNAKHL